MIHMDFKHISAQSSNFKWNGLLRWKTAKKNDISTFEPLGEPCGARNSALGVPVTQARISGAAQLFLRCTQHRLSSQVIKTGPTKRSSSRRLWLPGRLHLWSDLRGRLWLQRLHVPRTHHSLQRTIWQLPRGRRLLPAAGRLLRRGPLRTLAKRHDALHQPGFGLPAAHGPSRLDAANGCGWIQAPVLEVRRGALGLCAGLVGMQRIQRGPLEVLPSWLLRPLGGSVHTVG